MKINQPPVSHECIDGEVVIINMATGTYYSLRDLSARLWELVASGCSRAELTEQVATSYPQEESARSATSAFLDLLLSEGLVSEESVVRRPSSIELPKHYAAPLVETFTDLQEMLMLDPIHEVDAVAGWPHKRD